MPAQINSTHKLEDMGLFEGSPDLIVTADLDGRSYKFLCSPDGSMQRWHRIDVMKELLRDWRELSRPDADEVRPALETAIKEHLKKG
jgi:hypothetical protein